MSKINGIIAGYDPGGNDNHGLAFLEIQSNKPVKITIQTLSNVESVLQEIETKDTKGLGVDTLSCWCTGAGGWRPADLWLREKYSPVRNSIVSPNRLSGSMGINGMALLMEIREKNPKIIVSETHPKVLYYALTEPKEKYNYKDNRGAMDSFLTEKLGGLSIETKNEHEWDAVFSAYGLLQGMIGKWTTDLHKEKVKNGGRIVRPCGKTHYYWL